MSILVNKNTKLIVQGITGRDGSFHAGKMKEYGTNVVGGVSPGKGGQNVNGIPVFNTVQEAVQATEGNTSIIFVPAPLAADAILEASEAGIGLVVAISEGVPTLDMVRITPYLKKNGTKLIGSNCPGLISPDESLVGILPANIFLKGDIGLMSRSGTLTYEMVNQLTISGLGQSTCVGIGGDPVPGTNFIDCLAAFQADPETLAVMMIGEIGGSEEERAAEWIKANMTKPVVSYIAGVTAPPGRKMGHAGAIISGSKGTAQAKMDALAAAGVHVCQNPTEAGEKMGEIVKAL